MRGYKMSSGDRQSFVYARFTRRHVSRYFSLKQSLPWRSICKRHSSETIEWLSKDCLRLVSPWKSSIKLQGKAVNDEATLESLGLNSGAQLFLKDLGPQIGWKTVFLVEYAGPLLIYLWIYGRPALLYGSSAAHLPYAQVVHHAAYCWTGHYAKRLLETLFIHRFSHSTMPIRNLFKNCTYYWGFTAYVAYYVNHPLYTNPILGRVQEQGGLALFIFCEVGNFSIHLLLRNLRPAGSKQRLIPEANWNPMTTLFDFVSCPNYSYEVAAWMSFTFMTHSLPAALFTLAGFYQMMIWALQKHRSYQKDFPHYPRHRKAMIPFIL